MKASDSMKRSDSVPSVVVMVVLSVDYYIYLFCFPSLNRPGNTCS
jgi:hypothetical protein